MVCGERGFSDKMSCRLQSQSHSAEQRKQSQLLNPNLRLNNLLTMATRQFCRSNPLYIIVHLYIGKVGKPIGKANTMCRTTDTTFIDNPPASSKTVSKYSTPASRSAASSTRGTTTRGRYTTRGTTASRRGTSGIARARSRGVR